jgi:hypothetical protein
VEPIVLAFYARFGLFMSARQPGNAGHLGGVTQPRNALPAGPIAGTNVSSSGIMSARRALRLNRIRGPEFLAIAWA